MLNRNSLALSFLLYLLLPQFSAAEALSPQPHMPLGRVMAGIASLGATAAGIAISSSSLAQMNKVQMVVAQASGNFARETISALVTGRDNAATNKALFAMYEAAIALGIPATAAQKLAGSLKGAANGAPSAYALSLALAITAFNEAILAAPPSAIVEMSKPSVQANNSVAALAVLFQSAAPQS